ncbi:hypothetical protein ILUMI_03769 [Ignelater luminosus]|uniref:Uncharacterized protein n=1 Tax=Ignelater luminosus TaxID=2038154 RepID=A0A8K0DFQ8_IGNLU|nr:hypothetical protein ILUMI_03769 [Ignelater luminosus]
MKHEFKILPIKGTTRGADMMATFMPFAEKTNLPLHKLVAMSTAGAPSMIGRNHGWLSRGSFLERFLNLLPEIIAFLDTLGEKHEQLEDPVWVKKLVFLTDFMGHYNSLNLQLQGKGKNIIELYSSVNAFKAKLKLFASQLKRQNLEKHIKFTGECNIEMFCSELENFNQEFERRFANLNNL